MKSFLVVTFAAVVSLATLVAAAIPARAQSLEITPDSIPVANGIAVETLSVRATVEEGVALVEVDQTFRNGTHLPREGVWTVRLPEDAVVHTFSMWMEGREKQGQVLEAKAARQIYDSIVHQRKDPALLEETGWRTFRVSVFPIPARDTVRVRLRYAYVVPDDLGLHSLALPLPVGGAEIAALDVAVDVKSATGLSVIDALDRAGARIEKSETGATLRWSAERTRPAGPFVARFAHGGEGFSLALLAHRDEGAGEGHFLVRVVPRLAAAPDLPRDVVFVVDRSGSMQGKKIDQARAALVRGIATLRPVDRFGIVSFASDVRSLGGTALVPASEEWLGRARAEATALDASGGTNIAGALDAAATLCPVQTPGRMFVVVLLTDGDPTVGETNPDAILRGWKVRNHGRTRLFALGIGADVKDFLLSRLAEGSRGAAQYVADDDQLEVKLSSLFERVRTPLLVDPEITIEGMETRSVEPRPLPDVFRGGSVVLAGRFRAGGRADLVLRGTSGVVPVELRFPVVFPKDATLRPHVAQLWARMRIDRLLDDLRASGGERGALAEIRQEITDLGVKHQVVSPYTSFLVVEDGVHIPDGRELARVPDAAPAGDPRTAGGGPTGSGAHALGGGSHGGSYRGPSGEVPPDSREPSDPPPDAAGGGPGTPGGSDPGGPTTGGSGRKSGGSRGPGYEAWTWWWEYESDALLAGRTPQTPSPLDRTFVDAKLLPALRAIAADAGANFFVRAAALEALARMRDDAPATRELIAKLQTRELPAHRVVVERALLGPVWMDDHSEATRTRLLAVLADVGRPAFERSFAAVTLGVLGDKDDVRVARELLACADGARSGDVRPSAYLALGLLGDRTVVPGLAASLDSLASNGSNVDLAWLVAALGRLGDPGAPDASGHPRVSRLLRQFLADEKNTDRVVRRAIPRALASLSIGGDGAERARTIDVLRNALGDDDPSVVNEALLGLGRIAADPACAADRRRAIVERIADVLSARGRSASAAVPKDFARIALGLAAAGPERKRALAALGAVSGPMEASARGAAATASLLAGDATAAPALSALAADPKMPAEVRGRAALAFAGLGAPDARAVVASVLRDVTGGRGFRDALTAESLAGGGLDPRDLLTLLQTSDLSGRDGFAVAETIGRVGDAALAEQLLTTALDDRTYPDLTRASAIRALAGLVDRRPDPLDRICDGFLYRASVPALVELHVIATGR